MPAKKTVAVVIERTNGYARELIRGVADFAATREDIDFRLLEPETFDPRRDRYDGYICRVTSRALADRLARSRRPVVNLLLRWNRPSFASVRPDADAIGALAFGHFADRRFRRFAFCGVDSVVYSDLRRDAFLRAAAAHGAKVNCYKTPAALRRKYAAHYLIHGSVDTPPDADDLRNWLLALEKPVAIFCCDDSRAHQVLNLCRACGISIPDEAAVLGVDDDPVICTFSSPRLSSMDLNACGIGFAAAKRLCAILEGEAPGEPLFLPPKGISARASTDNYPVDPPWLSDAIGFISHNAVRGITAADVFARLKLSHTTVQKAFRRELGSSVQQEIIRIRLNEAKHLLAETRLSVTEIAAATGFSGAGYFIHAFTAAEGRSPLAYRRELGASEP